MKRYAIVSKRGLIPGVVQAYLPPRYQVIWVVRKGNRFGETEIVIQGEDYLGYTLDKYIIPRLNQWGIGVREIDLSHEVMKEIPMLGMGECTDDPGTGRVYICHDYRCPVHGERNRNISGLSEEEC